MNVLRTFDIVAQLVEKYPKEDALAIKRNGKWEKFSTIEYKNLADQVSFGLMASGFTKGDKII
ncbi:MAG: long-chain fatty acid--CoA ligase, partial [Bacteroidetes bacterium CG_4_10_14_3_um_filter_42_6]